MKEKLYEAMAADLLLLELEESLEKNSAEQKSFPQSRIEVDSSELFQYNNFAD